jgi:hypothetical protein
VRRDTLDASELRILKLQAPLAQRRRFFLAGGTALALRLGHRTSHDLDWFSTEGFDHSQLESALAALAEKPSTLQQGGPNTLRAYYGTLETSFIKYSQVSNPGVDEIAIDGVLVPVAAIEVIALTYFTDAERDPMPDRCAFTWPEVKRSIASGVNDWQAPGR